MDKKTPLQEAIDVAGGQAALARALNIRQSTVWTWLVRAGGKAAPELCIQIERATGVSRYRLRPDVFGASKSAQ